MWEEHVIRIFISLEECHLQTLFTEEKMRKVSFEEELFLENPTYFYNAGNFEGYIMGGINWGGP